MIKFVIVPGIVQMAMTNLHVTVRTHGIDRTMGYVYSHLCQHGLVWFMVFNATFNNISAILWRSVLLFEETGVPGENHRPVASH